MTLKEFLKTEEKIDTRTFSKFVRERREAMEISVRKMSYLLGITPTYLSDIERGKRTSPTKCLNALMEVLRISEDEKDDFKDLAYKSKETLAPELIHYLINSKEARKAVRFLIDKEVTGEQFLEMVENNK